MTSPSVQSSPQHVSHWLDTAVIIGITGVSLMISIHFNLNEALYGLTRRVERFQLDELPIATLVLLICLVWLSWRRYEQACREVGARRIAEGQLGAALAENRRLAQENLRIHEVERKHLARELHDELGQYLNAIKLDAVAICQNRSGDAHLSTRASLAIIRSVDHVHKAVNEMIGRLRPVALDELGLIAAVEHCVEHWRQRLPDTRFTLSVDGNFEGLSEQLNLTLYRLIQEGLTNVYKHANAHHADVSLERTGSAQSDTDELCLRVADDGCGIESTACTSRFGLSGMRERIEMAGGTFMLDTTPGKGLRFEARLPAKGASNG